MTTILFFGRTTPFNFLAGQLLTRNYLWGLKHTIECRRLFRHPSRLFEQVYLINTHRDTKTQRIEVLNNAKRWVNERWEWGCVQTSKQSQKPCRIRDQHGPREISVLTLNDRKRYWQMWLVNDVILRFQCSLLLSIRIINNLIVLVSVPLQALVLLIMGPMQDFASVVNTTSRAVQWREIVRKLSDKETLMHCIFKCFKAYRIHLKCYDLI